MTISLGSGAWQKIRTILYCIISVFVFVAWVMTIAVLMKDGSVGSPTIYFFILLWSCIPTLSYLAIVPLWSRFRPLSNPYANAAIDVCYVIFWLAAVIAVQVWTQSGIQDGAQGCAQWSYGTESKCFISHGTVVVGAAICLSWLLAATASVATMMFYRKHGYLPNAKPSPYEPKAGVPRPISKVDTEKPLPPQTRLHHERQDLEHGSVHSETREGTMHPGRILSYASNPSTSPAWFEYGHPPSFTTVNYGQLEKRSSPASISASHNYHTQPLSMRSPPSLATHPSSTRSKALSPPAPTATRYITPPRLELSAPSFNTDISASMNTSLSATGYDRLPTIRTPIAGTMSSQTGVEFRRSTARSPLPGPASRHDGGYASAYHTPVRTTTGSQLSPLPQPPPRYSFHEDRRLDAAAARVEELGRHAFLKVDYSR